MIVILYYFTRNYVFSKFNKDRNIILFNNLQNIRILILVKTKFHLYKDPNKWESAHIN